MCKDTKEVDDLVYTGIKIGILGTLIFVIALVSLLKYYSN